MKTFYTTVEMNATATAVVKADSLEEAREKFRAGDYELENIETDGVADCGNNCDAAYQLEEDETATPELATTSTS